MSFFISKLFQKFKAKKPIQADSSSPDKPIPSSPAFTFSRRKQTSVSPLNQPVWRLILYISGGCVLIWLAGIILGSESIVPAWIMALLSLATWILAVRMLFLDSRFQKFWLIWLSLGFILLFLIRGTGGTWIVSVLFSFVFLLFRRYLPYSHLSSRRKATLFLIGVFIFGLITLGFLFNRGTLAVGGTLPENLSTPTSSEQLSTLLVIGQNLKSYAIASLRFFWFISLFHLFFGIRLHFMRLRPKLAVSAFMLVVVPLFLVTVMGLLTLYGMLGESRAIRARNILQDWTVMAIQDQNFLQGISNRSFSYNDREGVVPVKGGLPPWAEDLCLVVKNTDFTFADWNTEERGAYFYINSEIWLLTIREEPQAGRRLEACQFDAFVLDRLAQILHCDVRLSISNPIDINTSQGLIIRSEPERPETERNAEIEDIYGRYLTRPDSQQDSKSETSSPSLWRRPIYFGMTHLDLIFFENNQIFKQNVLLLLEGSLAGLASEFSSENNPLSQVVLAILLALAFMMLFLEIFAFFFGLRITTGITSAVRALHQGTKRLAEGDLDTRIEIPNEDELGDLAVSFNEMAAAVKQGREEAVARERLELEIKTARKIQQKLLPIAMPDVPGFEIAGTSLPSQQVGGDYFDFLDMGKGQLGIAIGDVSGKGIPAALLMANLQASLHAQVIKPGEVAEVTSRINNLLTHSTDANMFATFFYGILDRNNSTFTSTNAGHNPPILIREDASIERLHAGGLIIGFLVDQKYNQETVTLNPGNVLVLFTDGITEAVDPARESVAGHLFGEERLIQVIKEKKSGTAREIQSAILTAIADHTGNSPQFDDITLVVIKRRWD